MCDLFSSALAKPGSVDHDCVFARLRLENVPNELHCGGLIANKPGVTIDQREECLLSTFEAKSISF